MTFLFLRRVEGYKATTVLELFFGGFQKSDTKTTHPLNCAFIYKTSLDLRPTDFFWSFQPAKILGMFHASINNCPSGF